MSTVRLIEQPPSVVRLIGEAGEVIRVLAEAPSVVRLMASGTQGIQGLPGPIDIFTLPLAPAN
jgi:hypothetical protein